MALEWNVWISDFNTRKIKPYNIFNHCRFVDDVKDIVRQCKGNKEWFADKVKASLTYYFWCKSEWEVMIDHLFSREDKYAEKVDVYTQIRLNWQHFIDYLWDNRKELK